MTFVKKEPTTFLDGEEGLNLEAFFIPVQSFICHIEICHQIDRVGKTGFPVGYHRDEPIAFLGKPIMWDAGLVIHLKEKILKRKLTSIFMALRILHRLTHLASPFDLRISLAMELSGGSHTIRNHPKTLSDRFGAESPVIEPVNLDETIPTDDLCGLHDQPGDRQRSLTINQAAYQRNMLMPNFAAITNTRSRIAARWAHHSLTKGE